MELLQLNVRPQNPTITGTQARQARVPAQIQTATVVENERKSIGAKRNPSRRNPARRRCSFRHRALRSVRAARLHKSDLALPPYTSQNRIQWLQRAVKLLNKPKVQHIDEDIRINLLMKQLPE